MLHHIRRTSRQLLSPEGWKIRLIFWCGAIVVGLLATLLAWGAEWAGETHREILAQWPWAAWLLTPLGLGFIAWLTLRFFPGSQGSGIPQSIAALAMSEHESRSILLSLRIAVGKMLLLVLGLLCGASIGREGPTVHIGAAVMFSLGRLARFPYHYMDKGLILAGGAAGIAAAFNTPLAGILFAIEELGRNFEERTSGVVLVGVFMAGVTAVMLQGNYVYFGTSPAKLVPEEMILPILVCGIGGGLFGGLFSTLLIQGQKWLAPWHGRWPVRVAILLGLLLAALGWLSDGQVYGTGYDQARLLVTGEGELPWTYAPLKFLASAVSYLTGIPGGIFAPSLAAGAGVGHLFSEWLPGIPVTAVVLLGMVGYFSGVVQTPITAFVIVMEMTDNNEMLLPLMATAFLARVISGIVCPEPIYRALAANFFPPAEPGTVAHGPSQDNPTETRT